MLEGGEEDRENKRPNLGGLEKKGTPPPTLPEVEKLTGGVKDGFLGGEDLFRDIR